MIPDYFHREMDKKQSQKKSVIVWFLTFFLYLPWELEILVTALVFCATDSSETKHKT